MPGIYSVQQIKFEIFGYIKEFGATFSDWYVGVADCPRETLVERHQLDPDEDIWLYRQAVSFAACQTVQRYFIDTLGTDGVPVVSGTAQTDCVYLYKKSKNTLP